MSVILAGRADHGHPLTHPPSGDQAIAHIRVRAGEGFRDGGVLAREDEHGFLETLDRAAQHQLAPVGPQTAQSHRANSAGELDLQDFEKQMVADLVTFAGTDDAAKREEAIKDFQKTYTENLYGIGLTAKVLAVIMLAMPVIAMTTCTPARRPT